MAFVTFQEERSVDTALLLTVGGTEGLGMWEEGGWSGGAVGGEGDGRSGTHPHPQCGFHTSLLASDGAEEWRRMGERVKGRSRSGR